MKALLTAIGPRVPFLFLLLSGCQGTPDPVRPDDATLHLACLDRESIAPLEFGDGMPKLFVFTTIDCPIANAYAPELRSIFAEHRSRVRCHLVHVDPDVSKDQARGHRDAYALDTTILFDPTHELVKRTGVSVTPEAALYDGRGNMVYRGRIDDLFPALGTRRRQAFHHDLRDALAAVLEGRPVPTPRTKAVGCYIADLRR
ncbi:MAG: redoxin domain-containing protein [Planctomycetes bacterium]|nr:redoxin domain-containing protein [Planctomycetota bacterium]